MLNEKQNAQMAKRIKVEMVKKAEQVADESQTDASFMANLQDLCQLNRMAESHQEPQPPTDGAEARDL
jgi:hypothetical protein